MGTWPMLFQRNGTWYYRRAVPVALQPLYQGRKQIWKSLRTSDYDRAKLLSLRVGHEVERELQSLTKRAETLQRLRPDDPAVPERIATDYAERVLSTDAKDRLAHPRPPRFHEPDELDGLLLALSSTIDDHARALDTGDLGIVSTLLDEVLTEAGLHVPAGQRSRFASALLNAHLRVLRTLDRRETGADRVTAASVVTVDGLLEKYLAERKLGSKSETEIRAGYRRFSAVVGGYKPVEQVLKADCRAYKESLLAAPSNRSLSKDGKLSATSVKKLLGVCSTIMRYGLAQGYLERNPFEGLTRVARKDTGGVERRLSYDSADLTAIFGSPEFAALTGARRFIPLIAALSGCRLSEAGGLRVKDVRFEASSPKGLGHEDGVWFLDFTPTTERGLKTASSRRRVPVHPELVRLGLLEYVKSVPQDGRLFPELRPGTHGILTDAFQKWWARFVRERGITDPRKAPLHSLRHLFKRRCREAGLLEEVHDALTGHVTGAVGRTYGGDMPVKVMAEAIARVRYPELEKVS